MGIILIVHILFCLILLIASFGSAKAFEAANPYWMNLKPRAVKFLEKNINTGIYKYELTGPVTEMKTFLGNRPDVEVKFDRLNLSGTSPKKTFVATAYDESGKKLDSVLIGLDVSIYKKVYMLRNSVPKGAEISASNIYQTTMTIKQMDTNLYFDGHPRQKVATIDIPAGVPIRVNMLRHEKMIQAGDVIKVSSGNTAIQLKFMCKAMNSADIGEIVSLNCSDMEKKVMRGRITADGQAELL